jgi:hypothetical protein
MSALLAIDLEPEIGSPLSHDLCELALALVLVVEVAIDSGNEPRAREISPRRPAITVHKPITSNPVGHTVKDKSE